MDSQVLIKPKDVKELLGISMQVIYKALPEWQRQGIAFKIGPGNRSWRVNRARLLEAYGTKVAA